MTLAEKLLNATRRERASEDAERHLCNFCLWVDFSYNL